MRSTHLIAIPVFVCLSASVLSACGNVSDNRTQASEHRAETAIDTNRTQIDRTDSIKKSIFGVETATDEYSVARNLEKAGVLKIDSLSMEDGKFQFAIIEFAGVKFGMNRGFKFFTSQQNKKTIDSLVKEISKYYGEPDVDGEDDEPEWLIYHWNLYTGYPYIRIRPARSEEGGLTMMWELHRPYYHGRP